MKKLLLILLLMFTISLASCGEENDSKNVLRLYNWQDYIDDALDENGVKIEGREAVIDLWIKDYKERTHKDVEVIYDTFETNETMLNTLKTGKTTYDLVCPSEYTIEKMLSLDMLEKYDATKIPNYYANASKYILNVFDNIGMSDYVAGYMWGTMGLIYNRKFVTDEDVATWAGLWNEKYNKQISIKDSVRDTYCITVLYVYYDELVEALTKYKNGTLSEAEYNLLINEIMNRSDDATIKKVEEALKKLKSNIYGFEVDNGKSDVVAGKININLAWSGDAVYSMDLADENGIELGYSVPNEGSNIWFDGWVMPKGANKELAQDFVNFMSQPFIAAKNMEKIGYTCVIGGNEVYDLLLEWYDDETSTTTHDVTWFFGDNLDEGYYQNSKLLIRTSETNRQLQAQYPDYETVIRCGVMKDFGAQNEKVLEMWSNIKGVNISIGWYIAVGIVIIGSVVFVISFQKSKTKYRRKH